MTLLLDASCHDNACLHYGHGWRCTHPDHEQPRHRMTDIAKATGVTYRQLDHWAHAGYLHLPDAAPGSGNYRLLSDTEATIAEWVGALVADGVTPARAATLARDLWTVGHAKLAGRDITWDAT